MFHWAAATGLMFSSLLPPPPPGPPPPDSPAPTRAPPRGVRRTFVVLLQLLDFDGDMLAASILASRSNRLFEDDLLPREVEKHWQDKVFPSGHSVTSTALLA